MAATLDHDLYHGASGPGKCLFTMHEAATITPELVTKPPSESVLTQHAGSYPSLNTSDSPILRIYQDVFDLIAAELLKLRGDKSLSHLSVCCRRLRQLSLPVLFSRCTVATWHGSDTGIPPHAIRPYARHLTYDWTLYAPQYIKRLGYRPKVVLDFSTPLLHLPYVRSVTFNRAAYGIRWEVLERCFSFPQVESISFTASATFTFVPPFPVDAGSTTALKELCYPTPLLPQAIPYSFQLLTTANGKVQLERACLSTLIPQMNATAQILVLPMRTAPLDRMAQVDWPNLHDLFLGGAFPHIPDYPRASYLQAMLLRMPNLRHLAVVAALPLHTGLMYCLISQAPTSDSFLQDLRSLVIAYPHPSDPLFSIPFPKLTSLSLRDWPRHYRIVAEESYRYAWKSPILSAADTLSILRRLRAPHLTTLELVYLADDADNDLLDFLSTRFSKLRHLELHRYRRSSDKTVDHRHIARTLSACTSLVTLRLNLDFPGDPGEYRAAIDRSGELMDNVFTPWRSRLIEFGWDVLEAMVEQCPLLEGVGLLYHATPPSSWFWFLRSRLATRAYLSDSSDENRDLLPSSLPVALRGRIMKY